MTQGGSRYPVASALPYPAFVVNDDRQIVYANDAARSRFGRGKKLEGLPCHEAVHPDEGVLPDCPLEEAKTKGDFVEHEVFDEGSGDWYRYGVYPMDAEKADGPLYFHTFEDVTEQVESKREIRRLNRTLRTMSASNQALLRAEDEQDLMREVCRVAVEVGGFRLAWVGRKEKDPERSITPVVWAGHNEGFLEQAEFTWGDGPYGQGSTPRAIRSGRPAVTHSVEDPAVAPWKAEAKERGYLSSAGLPLVVEGEVYGVLALYAGEENTFGAREMEVLDELAADLAFGISALRTRNERQKAEAELKNSEKRYRTLVEGSPYGIGIVDGNSVIRYANPAAARILGSCSLDDVVGRPMTDFIRSDFEERAWDLLSLVDEKGCTRLLEQKVVRMDGIEADLEITGIPFELEGGPAAYLMIRDVTGQKQAQAELRESREQLYQWQKLESVGQLAGGVAHDFNNLLAVVVGDAELLLNEDGTVELRHVRHYVEEIRTAATRGTNLISQLLAFSRRQPYQARVVHLNDVVSDMNALLARTMREDIEIDTTLGDNLPPVEIDPHRLEQAVLNLAANARDAMDGGGKLTIETAEVVLDESYVSTHLGAKPGEYVMLAVSDNGSGMDQDTAARIFDPFFTTKKEGEGTGLGLSTVYGIVKQFGGNIWVYSEPGIGTTFKIYLPCSTREVDWFPVPEKQPMDKGNLGGEETVLVVEDEDSVCRLAERILSSEGYKVRTAASGAEVLDAGGEHLEDLDLLLTDVVLPGMSGKELADTLQERHPDLKILYMSGYTKNAIVHEGRLDEDVTLVEKPFGLDQLTRAVRETLDTR